MLTGSPPPLDNISFACAPRRTVLDKILLDAALGAGVEWREAFTVRDLVCEHDHVVGIRGAHTGGTLATERARVVIGADGLHSKIAKLVAAPTYNAKPTLGCYYYSYWSGAPLREAEIYVREHRCIIAFPTNDELTLVVIEWPHGEFERVRADVEGAFDRALRLAPRLHQRIAGGRREERFFGTADVPNFFRKPYGAGWALVGDAGYHKDPLTAQGIMDAFRAATWLSEALQTTRNLDVSLASYEQRRNDSCMPMYELTCARASLAPPPSDAVALLNALRGKQSDIDRFIGVEEGTVPFEQFYSGENLARILAQA